MLYLLLAFFMLLQLVCSQDTITTIAGTGTASYSGDNSAATSATLKYPSGSALDSSGMLLSLFFELFVFCEFVDFYSRLLQINIPMTNAGNIYIADAQNNRIRKVTVSTGIITTIAGSSTNYGYNGDGAATSALLYYPTNVVLDSSGIMIFITIYCALEKVSYAICYFLYYQNPINIGNVYTADRGNNRIRKVTITTGIITTIAGSDTSGSYGGDSGQATSATLNAPYGMALDSSGIITIVITICCTVL